MKTNGWFCRGYRRPLIQKDSRIGLDAKQNQFGDQQAVIRLRGEWYNEGNWQSKVTGLRRVSESATTPI